jgi:hypothetical protein
MKILIVGAGAVGLVYGHHFANAGHQVTFMVKEKYQAQLNQEKEAGVILYHLNSDKKLLKPQHFKNFESINHWDDAQGFDLVALAISSNALRQLPLDQIEQTLIGTDTDLLMLQPSATDFEHLSQVIVKEKIFQGMISLISYQTDEVNQNIKPAGTAYYLPPMPMPISASTESQQTRLKNIVSLFKNSAIPAKAVKSAIDDSKIPSAFLMTFLCALEAANWEFKRLGQSADLLKKLSAAQQSLLPQQITEKGFSNSLKRSSLTLLLKVFLRPGLYKLLLKMAPQFVPLPLEAYLKKHFMKVRLQTVIYMQEYKDLYPANAVTELNQLLHRYSKTI